jgi:hypothetical protein
MNNDTVVRKLDAPGQQDDFTRDLTDAAIRFIRRNASAGKPFFAYIPHPMPHVPLATSAAFKDASTWGPIGNVVEELDASVGRILDTLRELGLEQNTLVLFSSDNGPWLNFGDHAGSTGGLREGKGTSFEGGVRVPFIARWPGRITPGVVTNQVAATIDVLPTVAALTGAALPQHKIDGVDLRPLLLERDPAWKRPPFFIHYHGPGPRTIRFRRSSPATGNSSSPIPTVTTRRIRPAATACPCPPSTNPRRWPSITSRPIPPKPPMSKPPIPTSCASCKPSPTPTGPKSRPTPANPAWHPPRRGRNRGSRGAGIRLLPHPPCLRFRMKHQGRGGCGCGAKPEFGAPGLPRCYWSR